ncbi:MAG: hypothetical protein ACK58N_16105 [Synechocystis sp.]
MKNNFYSQIAPDWTDSKNKTKNCPGYLFEIAEDDGGIIITMADADKPDATERENLKGIFIGIAEAEEILAELQNTINSAKSKTKGKDWHSGRVK